MSHIDSAAVDYYPKSYDLEKRLRDLLIQSNIRLDDLIKREQAKLRQYYEDRFEHELRQLEECNKRGDFIQAYYHHDMAKRIIDMLKTLE